MTRIALVTGSTSNIGKAIAERLAEDGYHVIVTSRHGEEAEDVASSLQTPGSGFEVDFADPVDIQALFDHVREEFGRLDVLVNNVATSPKKSVLECDQEAWDYTMHTNLRSYFLCSREAGKLMTDAGEGSIVNVTIARTGGTAGKVAYSVSKAAIKMLTYCSALDLAPHGVRVNAVGSGLVGTPVGHEGMAHRSEDNDRVPVGHVGDPADLADAVGYLVSDEAEYVVGAVLPVDGGKSIS